MAKSLLGRLFGQDPTAGWPEFAGKAPPFDLDRLAFGSLRLGDPLEGARALGRPSRLKGARGGTGGTILEYDAGGFTLEFRDGKLVCIGFTTATAEDGRLNPGAAAAEPSVGGLRLTERTSVQDVRAWYGEPTSESGVDGLTWVEYAREGATLEFEFDAGKGLGYVQIYADGYA